MLDSEGSPGEEELPSGSFEILYFLMNILYLYFFPTRSLKYPPGSAEIPPGWKKKTEFNIEDKFWRKRTKMCEALTLGTRWHFARLATLIIVATVDLLINENFYFISFFSMLCTIKH